MDDIVTLARDLVRRYPVRHVVIASLGEGARLTAEAFGVADYEIHAIGNTWDVDDCLVAERADALRESGVKVHLLGNSLFQALRKGGPHQVGDTVYEFEGDDFWGCTLDEVVARAKEDPHSGVFQVIYQTLQSLFSDGPRMCVEIALMAADAGIVPTDEDILSIDRPLRKSNCPHSAMVLRPSRTQDLLNRNQFRVKQLITVPGWVDRWFDNGSIWSG
jgi:hypothetical protein